MQIATWRGLGFLGLVATFALNAQPVHVDPSFHPVIADGRVVGTGTFTLLQPDGKLIVDSGRARFLPDGTRDSAYALAKELSAILNATVALDGRIFARCLDLNGNELPAILSPNGTLLGHPSAPLVTKGIFQPDGKLLTDSLRLNPDGSLDTTFNLGSGGFGTGDSFALQPDGKVIIGTSGPSFDGGPRKNLVRVTSAGLVDLSFNAEVENPVVAVQILGNGKLLVFDGTAKSLRLLNPDGSLARIVGPIAGDVVGIYRFALTPDGNVLAGGVFTSIAGLPRRNLARITADGVVDASFDASPSIRSLWSPARNFAVQANGRIVVGGDNVRPSRLLRLNANGSPDATFVVGAPSPAPYFAMAPRADGRVYLAGAFSSIDGVALPGIARLLADGTVDRTFSANASLTLDEMNNDQDHPSPAQLQVVPLPDGGVVVSGTLIAANSTPRSRIVRFSAEGSVDTALNPTPNAGGKITTAAVLPDSRLIVGGDFSTINGQARANLAIFQTTGALDPSFGPDAGANGPVRLLVANPNARVFVSGDFTTLAGSRRNALAALTPAGILDTGFVPGTLTNSDKLTALAPLPDGGVIIAPALRHLKSNGDLDAGFGFPFQATPNIAALAADKEGRVIVSYSLDLATNVGRDVVYTKPPFLQRFTTSGAFDPSFTPSTSFSSPATTLAVAPDGSILVGGGNITVNGAFASPLLQLVASPGVSNGLLNVSTRGETGQGASVLTAGFVIGGTTPKTVLIRAAGPSLTGFGVTGALSDPVLTLFQSGAAKVTNDNWANKKSLSLQPTDTGFLASIVSDRVGAFALAPLDSALAITLAPGAYTAQAQAGGGETSGVTLLEVYDTDGAATSSRLINISSRGTAGTGAKTLIAGFVVSGDSPRTVLVRGVGPGLIAFNTEGTLADPMLTLADASGKVTATNNDWGSAANASEIANAAAKVGAFALANGSTDSALLVTLAPGNYTAAVNRNDASSAAGVALIEVYEVP